MIFRYYIGSDNTTGELEEERAVSIIAKQFEGFTAFKGLGYWQGIAENTLIVEVETENEEAVKQLAKNLAKELKQDAIGLAKAGSMEFITA